MAALTIFSFRPGRPIGDDTVDAAVTFAGQAALAVDNARLYQQQKEFADTMQRSLLPSGHPDVHGLEAHGLILGIDSGQTYEEVRELLPEGALLVLYTDGVIESRRDGELYETERLDALLSEHRELSARELAERVAADARRWAGGE